MSSGQWPPKLRKLFTLTGSFPAFYSQSGKKLPFASTYVTGHPILERSYPIRPYPVHVGQPFPALGAHLEEELRLFPWDLKLVKVLVVAED